MDNILQVYAFGVAGSSPAYLLFLNDKTKINSFIIMQVEALIDYFNLIATKHKEIESFGTGDLFEVAIAGEDIYVQLWLEQIFQTITTKGVITWNVAFIIHSIQKHDESDENSLLDKTFTIGQQVIQKIKNDGLYVVGDSTNSVSFTERFEDFCTGWRFEITLKEALRVDRCNIDFVFDLRCNYAAVIDGADNEYLNAIVVDGNPLSLVNVPALLVYNPGDTVPALNVLIQAELVALGYNATIIQGEAPNGPGGKGTIVTLGFAITESIDEFQCLVGSSSNITFTAQCTCLYTSSANNADIGSTLDIIKVNGVPLVLSSLPFDFTFSNVNFEADRLALENELISLGYEATVTDTTPPASLGRTITIEITNPPTGDEFNTMSGPVGFANFLYQCT